MFRRFSLIFCLCLSLQAKNTSEVIELIGDIVQIALPVATTTYSLCIKDYEGIKDYAIGLGSTLGSILITKETLNAIAKKHPDQLRFAQRPNHSNFKGFPSGHTATAFSAVGFLQKRYGWKFALPAAILASFVGYSRIQAQRHTPFQVVAGAMLSFAINYLVTSRYIDPNKHSLSISTRNNAHNRYSYSLNYRHRF